MQLTGHGIGARLISGTSLLRILLNWPSETPPLTPCGEDSCERRAPTRCLVPVEHDPLRIAGLLLNVRPKLVVLLKNVLCHLAYVLDRLLATGLDAAGGNVLGHVAINIANESRERWTTLRARWWVDSMCTEYENRLRRIGEKWDVLGIRDGIHAAELHVDPAADGQIRVTEK